MNSFITRPDLDQAIIAKVELNEVMKHISSQRNEFEKESFSKMNSLQQDLRAGFDTQV